MRYTESGQSVTNFSVATSNKWKAGDGQQQEETVWFRVSVWGKLAEVCDKHLAKGRQVLCEGRLTVDRETGGPRIWTDNNGNPRASYELTAFTVKFLGTRDDAPAKTAKSPGMTEDEIPF